VLALGGAGAHVPYHLLWAHEHVEEAPNAPGRFFQIESLRDLPAVVASLA
jgi:putative hydrolase of the HAD superfamily